jgi:enoyl-CoA hydratase
MEQNFLALSVERDGPVATLVLRGPGKGNAMGPALWRELAPALAALDADLSVRAVVLHGSGDHFSYGLDVQSMLAEPGLEPGRAQSGRDRAAFLDVLAGMQNAFNAVANARMPVIAAIDGWCIGSGVELIAACDLRYATPAAQFSLREVQLAIVADLGGLQRLPAIIGEGNARELALTGRTIDAARAHAIGLVNEIADDVHVHAARVAAEIAAYSPLTTSGIKRVMNASQNRPVADGLAFTAIWNAAFLNGEDFAEAMAAFRERRKADYR